MTRDLPRRTALLLLALLVAGQLWLGGAHVGYGLPYVYHSDAAQIEEAASLLKLGWYADYYNYPQTLVFVYAAAARAAFALERAGGPVLEPPRTPAGASGTWAAFVERFQDPTLHHVVGRSVSVLAGCLLVAGVYRLGRVRCSRAVSLLAAAIVAADPVLVMTEHQARPHVPMVAALVLAAPSVLRLVTRPATSALAAVVRAAVAGGAAGLSAALLQAGGLLLVAGAALVAMVIRPWRRAAVMLGGLAAGSVAVTWTLDALFRATGAVRPVLVRTTIDDTSTMAIPRRIFEYALWTGFPHAVEGWLAAAPALFAGVLVYIGWHVNTRRARREAAAREAPSDLLLYGTFPAIALPVMGALIGGHVRYLLAAAPFLAVLAAAACARLPRWAGGLLALLLVGLPLASSLRYHALLETVNSRVGVDALLHELDASAAGGAPLVIAVQDRLVLDRSAMPAGAIEFPPHDDVASAGADRFPARQALHDSGAEIYARIPAAGYALGPLSDGNLAQMGFRLYGTVHAAPVSRLFLPDVPDHITTDLWRASRTGPPIEIWVAGAEAQARLARVAPAAALDGWTSDPAHIAGAAVRRREAAVKAAAAGPLPDVPCDLDGDGSPESAASNVDAALLARLLTLPRDRWADAGGALTGSLPQPPRLAVRGTLLNDEPVLLLVTGAAPRAAVHVIVGTRELRARFAGGLMVPAPELVLSGLSTGTSGALALSALWPHRMPIGLPVVMQCWIEDPPAAGGFNATNAVTATTPG